jgi:uncharacterized protein (TIGR02145 family)
MFYYFLLGIALFFVSCTDVERDDPDDPKSKYYNRVGTSLSSSSAGSSSSSSNFEDESSSSEEEEPSSSSFASSSSSKSIQYDITPGPSVFYMGETYETVVIKGYTWFNRNLNYNVSGSKCYGEGVSGVSADSVAKNCAKYGRLYDWATAMAMDPSCNTKNCPMATMAEHRGICPSGWIIPFYSDWYNLMENVDYNVTKLEIFGFAPLGGGRGYLGNDNYFTDIGRGYWWTGQQDNERATFGWVDNYINSSALSKNYLYSVRCVKN